MQGRFSGASAGWDWGALTATTTGVPKVMGGDQGTFSKGIWRDIYLIATAAGSVALEHTAPLLYYNGAYPVAPLDRASAGPWTLSLRAQVRVPAGGATGALSVAGSWGGEQGASGPLTLPAGVSLIVVNVTVAAGAVDLWWPNGLGAPALYTVTTTWTPSGSDGMPIAATRRIGFRTVVIVTADDSDPSTLAGRDGSGNMTVRWRVNGANVYLRGADVIPMEAMEGRQSDVAYRSLVASAAAAHMNVLRVDGIDLYFPDVYYDACDEEGILTYHDIQYSQGNAPPAVTPLQRTELIHVVRRLAHHPSLAVYDGCNECGGQGACIRLHWLRAASAA